jgi:hypothetical protein
MSLGVLIAWCSPDSLIVGFACFGCQVSSVVKKADFIGCLPYMCVFVDQR